MNKIIVFFCAIMFFCCSPQQRIKRLLKKHPELVHTINTTIIDTFITKSYHYDTLLKANYFRDTIVINKNHIETKFFYDYKKDTLFISNNVAPDTLIKTITIQGKTIEIKNKFDGLKYWCMILLIILLLIGCLKAIRKK